jgi:hypothetical protein
MTDVRASGGLNPLDAEIQVTPTPPGQPATFTDSSPSLAAMADHLLFDAEREAEAG